MANRGLGLILYERQRFADAIPFLQQSLRAPDPLPGRTARSLAHAYRRTGRGERALEVLLSAQGDVFLRGTPSQRLLFEKDLSEAKHREIPPTY